MLLFKPQSNKLLSERNRPDNKVNCVFIDKSINHAKKSEIQRAFNFFGGFAWYTMCINHRRSHFDNAYKLKRLVRQ